jgi:hypothetical protein
MIYRSLTGGSILISGTVSTLSGRLGGPGSCVATKLMDEPEELLSGRPYLLLPLRLELELDDTEAFLRTIGVTCAANKKVSTTIFLR